ncbi:MAG TPA: hypothetical protein VGM37_07075 [Armatimonadota bacterium]
MQGDWQFEDREADVDNGDFGPQDGGIDDAGSAEDRAGNDGRPAGRKGGSVQRDRDVIDDDLMDPGDNIGSIGSMASA